MRNLVLMVAMFITTTVLFGCTVESNDNSAIPNMNSADAETGQVGQMNDGMNQAVKPDGGSSPMDVGTITGSSDAAVLPTSDSGTPTLPDQMVPVVHDQMVPVVHDQMVPVGQDQMSPRGGEMNPISPGGMSQGGMILGGTPQGGSVMGGVPAGGIANNGGSSAGGSGTPPSGGDAASAGMMEPAGGQMSDNGGRPMGGSSSMPTGGGGGVTGGAVNRPGGTMAAPGGMGGQTMMPDAQIPNAFIYPECDLACCPGFPWRRPGGFWSDLAGHTPDWRPSLDFRCPFDVRRDDCERIRGFTRVGFCAVDDCDQCALNLNESRHRFDFAYDGRGNLLRENSRRMRHIDLSDDIFIEHTYDERGLRIATTGRDLPENERPRNLYLRYTYNERGQLIREEAMDEPFFDFGPPQQWIPTRISSFTYFADRIEEDLDSNGDGIVDQVLAHPR